ncbi:MAG: DUF445 family protein [Oscillospiraceae bacterium]
MIKMLRPKVLGASAIGAAAGFTANCAVTKILFRPEHPLKINGKIIPYAQGILPASRPQLADAVEKFINSLTKNPKCFLQLQTMLLKPETQNLVVNFLLELIYVTGDKKTINEILSMFLSDEKKEILLSELKVFIAKLLVEKTDKEFLGTLITTEGIKIFKEATSGSVLSKLMNEKLFAALADAISVAVHKFVETSATEKILDIVFKELDALMDMTIPALLKQLSLDEEEMRKLLEAVYEAILLDIIPHLMENIDLGASVKELILKIDFSKAEKFLTSKCRPVLLGFDAVGALTGGLVAKIIAVCAA